MNSVGVGYSVSRFWTVIGGCLLAATLVLGGQAPARKAPPPEVPRDFGGSERYLTHITTDKPIYRAGENVYVRGVMLSAHGHSPKINSPGGQEIANFEIKGPKGDTVASGITSVVDSTVGFSWDIPANQPGGEYTVRIFHPSGDAPAERKFDVRAYRAPRLKSQIAFVRDGYGPGDTVAANLHVERAEGGVPAKARVSINARVDGEEIWKSETVVDASGNATASFKLPPSIARGDGVIAMVIQDGGTVETAAKTIPILLQTIDVAFYPEGGDLIADLTNRVYVEAKTPAQKPADMAGFIVNSEGKQVATFRTEHEGRGRFSFIPTKGEAYSLRVTEPAGIKANFPLPSVKGSGVVLASTSDVITPEEDVILRVAGTSDGTYGVALTQRGKEFAFKAVTLTAKRAVDVPFTVPRSLDGVIVATVYDDHKKPLAERLLFRQPEHHVKVQVVPDHTDYVPGDKVTLKIATIDDLGKPVGAVVGLTVTDSSVLEMIEKRDQAPQLPVMVLLENDVRNLSDAHVYLDRTNPKAPRATDLLLGTQGWRRFATIDPAKFVTAYNDAARRALAIKMPPGKASLTGTVADSAGAVIPGVTVVAVNLATGLSVAAITNESGVYAFPGVTAGRYRVSASLPGFQSNIVTNVQVSANQPARQNFRLAVANANVRVEVVAGPIPAAAAAGEVLEVKALPLADKKVLDLLKVEPKLEKDQLMEGLALDRDFIGGLRAAAPRADVLRQLQAAAPVTVRQYAHALRPNRTESSREDFTETVYWNAGVKTDASTGLATVSFNLSDSVTSFRVLSDAFAEDGTLGAGISHIESVQPFSIEPKVPLQVTSGDVIQLPIGIINGMSRELRGAQISAGGSDGIKLANLGDNSSTLRAKERARKLLQVEIGPHFSGLTNLTFDGKAGPYRDSVKRQLDVQPLGYPYEVSTGGILESNSSKTFSFTLPKEIVDGSVSSNVTLYPTPLASMTNALQSLLREPYGCFEQTSSTSYPMVMAQQYFLTHTGIEPSIIEKTRSLLDVSYKRLTGFETRTRGYEWFGADPGHEALTAYGLMQFTDMARVRTVDKDMLDRTRSWLLSRRDGKGGFSLNPRALDSFGRAPADTTNAYIVWALVESEEKGLDKEIAAVKASANSTSDSYVVALAANILHATGDRAGAHQLMDKLAKNQDSAGKVTGANTSITRSGGDALAIETTALSVLAWLGEPDYAAQIEKGLKWIVESNKDGRFGSTQSTILALRSIVAYDAAHARPKAPGRMILTVDGRPFGTPLTFTANTQGALVLPDFANELGPGKHTVSMRMEDGSKMPFSVSVKYHSTLPDSDERAQVGIAVTLKDGQIEEGGVTEATVSIVNKTDAVLPTPVAIVGIPGGLEVRHDQLKELVKSGKIDAYEVIGREVVLYWRLLKANDKRSLPLSLVAAVPGSYTGPASRAYLYYTDEYKTWTPGVRVTITPR